MASNSCASAALFLALNLLFFSLVSACGTCPNRPGTNPNNPGRNPNNPGTNPNNPGRNPNNPGTSPNNPGTNPNNPGTNPNNPGTNPNNPGTNPNNPGNNPVPTPAARGRCPRDALKLGVCANLLGGAIGVIIGTPPQLPCCTLLQGLVDLEAAICLCTAIRANILGLNLNLPISLSLILNSCGRRVPTGFQC